MACNIESIKAKIIARSGHTPESWQRMIIDRNKALHQRLSDLLRQQFMTDEVLNKRCTL